MSDFYLYMFAAFGLFSIGIVGVVIKRALAVKFQSLFLTLAGAGIAYINFGRRFGNIEPALLFTGIILILFLFLFLSSLIILSKVKSGNDRDSTQTEQP